MSENEIEKNPPQLQPQAATSLASQSAAGSASKKPRKWRRRILGCCAIAILLCAAFRVTLPWLLPWTLRKVADGYDLACTYKRLELSMHGGDAELWHLTVAPKEGGEPYFHAEYCRADISTPQLLLGRIVIRRLEADGVDLLVERESDGSLAILKRIEKAAARSPPAKPEPGPPPAPGATSKDPSREIDLTPPIVVDAMRLQHLHALIRDRSVIPPFETRFNLNVRLSDLASRERPARFELEASSPPVLDSFTIEGEGTSLKSELKASCFVELKGLHLEPLAGYLSPLGLRPIARNLSFRARARIETKANGLTEAEKKAKTPTTLSATVALREISLETDSAEAMALDDLSVNVEKLGWRVAHVKDLVLQGLRVTARKTPEGLVRAAGFELTPATPRPLDESTEPPQPQTAPAAVEAPLPEPFRARLDLLAIRDVRVSFQDESVSPPALVAMVLEDFSARNVILDRDNPNSPVDISAQLAITDLVKKARFEGQATPFAKKKTVDLKVSAIGIVPGALKPYLRPQGIESLLENGSFTTSLNASVEETAGGRLRADLTIGKTTFGDKQTLLELGGLKIGGVELNSTAGQIEIAEIVASGPRLSARRSATGEIEALGFRISPRLPAAPGASPTKSSPRSSATRSDEIGGLVPGMAKGDSARAAPAVKAEAEQLPATHRSSRAPRVLLGQFNWTGFAVQFLDEAMTPPVTTALEDLRVELAGMTIDLADPPTAGVPGQLNVTLKVPGIAESVKVTGTVLPQPSQGSVKLVVAATGVTLKAMAPYLKSAGLEPELEDGSLELSVAADYAMRAGVLTANTALGNVSYRDGASEIAGLDALRISGLEVGSRGIKIAALEIEKPRGIASRDAVGSLHAGGLRLPMFGPRIRAAPPENAVPAEQPPAKTPPREATPQQVTEPFTIELLRFKLLDARGKWSDAVPSQAVAASLRGTVELNGLVLGREAEPARWRAHLSSEGVLDNLAATGTVALTPKGPTVSVEVEGRGLKAGPLLSYLPQGVTSKLSDGRFRAKLEAALTSLEAGGQSVSLALTGVDYREGTEPDSFLKLESFRVMAPRVDPEGGRIEIDEISLAGFETRARLNPESAVELLGFSIKPPPKAPEPAVTKPIEAKAISQTQAAGKVAPAIRPRKLPLVTLRKLDLNLQRIAVSLDHDTEGKAIVTTLRLASAEPIELLGEDPEAHKAIQLTLTGKVDPLVDVILVALKISPFAKDPELDVQVALQGIQGKDLTTVLPFLRAKLDGKGLVDGRFQAHVSTTLKLARRNPIDFDLSKGFGANLLVEKVAFTNGKDGPVLLGLDSLGIELVRMNPGTGDLQVKELEIQNPIANVKRTAEGLEILGLVVQLPGPQEKPTLEVTPAVETVAVSPAATTPAATAVPPPELRLDKLFVSGLDVRVADTTTEPPTNLWLSGLDVDVRNLTNRILSEPVTTRFQVSVRAGKVPLPVVLKGSLVAGVLGDAAALLSMQAVDTAPRFEDRELFEEILLKGKLGLYPNPTGWIQSKISALDLTGFKGLAARSGVQIESGIFDKEALIRLPGDGSAEVDFKSKFADLSMTEPPDGPIKRYLGLPSPVDHVVFLLRDNEGSVTIPFSVTKQPGPFGSGDMASVLWAVPKTIGQVLATAILSSPLRVVGTATDLLPFGGEAEKKPEEPLLLEFAPGDARLGPTEATKLAPLLKRLRDGEPFSLTITHEFGAQDLKRSEIRGNPTVEECLELGARLRREKAALLHERDEMAARTHAAVVSGLFVEAPKLTDELRALDQRVAETDLALEQVYGLTRPGAERLVPQRTRNAALALARARVEEVKTVFLSSGITGIQDALKAPRPSFTETAPEEPGKIRLTIAPTKKQ